MLLINVEEFCKRWQIKGMVEGMRVVGREMGRKKKKETHRHFTGLK